MFFSQLSEVEFLDTYKKAFPELSEDTIRLIFAGLPKPEPEPINYCSMCGRVMFEAQRRKYGNTLCLGCMVEKRAKQKERSEHKPRNYLARNLRVRRYVPNRDAVIDLLFEQQGGACGICGEPVKKEGVHIDHIKPIACGGTSEIDNLQLAHAHCNQSKGAKTRLPKVVKIEHNGAVLKEVTGKTRKRGRPQGRAFQHKRTIGFTAEQNTALETIADRDGKSVADIVRECVNQNIKAVSDRRRKRGRAK